MPLSTATATAMTSQVVANKSGGAEAAPEVAAVSDMVLQQSLQAAILSDSDSSDSGEDHDDGQCDTSKGPEASAAIGGNVGPALHIVASATAAASSARVDNDNEPMPKRMRTGASDSFPAAASTIWQPTGQLPADLDGVMASVSKDFAVDDIMEDTDRAFNEACELMSKAKASVQTLRLASRHAKGVAQRVLPALGKVRSAAKELQDQKATAQQSLADVASQISEVTDRCRTLEEKDAHAEADIEMQRMAAMAALTDRTEAEASLSAARAQLQRIKEQDAVTSTEVVEIEARRASMAQEIEAQRTAAAAALKAANEQSAVKVKEATEDASMQRGAGQAALEEAQAELKAAEVSFDEANQALKHAKQRAEQPSDPSAPEAQLPAPAAPPCGCKQVLETAAGEEQQPRVNPAAVLKEDSATGCGNPVAASLGVVHFNMQEPGEIMVQRAAKRLHVAAVGAPGVQGEYKLACTVNGRPAYRLQAAAGPVRPPFLMWLPRGGGCWVFSTEALQPAEKDGVAAGTAETPAKGAVAEFVAAGTAEPLARSTQLAYTALPEELMSTSWTKASWDEPRVKSHIVVMRA